jgi:hypothetical protein
LNILQIPAAQFVEKTGYRAFVLRGWMLRALFVLAVAMVPLLPARFNAPTRIALMLFLLFAYNASRGISLCGLVNRMRQRARRHCAGSSPRYPYRERQCTHPQRQRLLSRRLSPRGCDQDSTDYG